MDTREYLKQLLSRLPISNNMKLFLFGITDNNISSASRIKKCRASKNKWDTEMSKIDDAIYDWISDGNNLSSDFCMESMAKSLGFNRKAISTYFEHYIETDFRTWRTTMRIEKAKELLIANSECDISDIAKAVGLNDKSNFHRQFKQITGCTPSRWRETGGHPGILD